MTLGIRDVLSWKRAFFSSIEELSESFLENAPVIETGCKQVMPNEILGAFVQLVCSEGAVLLGITSSAASCNELAKIMLGMSPEDEISEDDANDAMGEMINVAAGSVKTKIAAQVGNIELGLPLFLSGRLHAMGHVAVESTDVTIGAHECTLVVFALTGKSEGSS